MTRKNIIIIVLSILFCLIFVSCANNSLDSDKLFVGEMEDGIIESSDKSTDSFIDRELSYEVIEDNYLCATEILNENGVFGGGNYLFDRKYEEETYNIAYLRTLYEDEITILPEGALDQWIADVYMKKSADEQSALPAIYQAIHDLNISKDDLIALNESRKQCGPYMIMSDEYIDALYLTEIEMMQELVDPLALYYDGVIYTWNDLNNTITSSKKSADIPASVMKAYIDYVITYCGEQGFITGNAVERFFGSTSAVK